MEVNLKKIIGCHGIDPEHEGDEGVLGEISNGDTSITTNWKHVDVKIVTRKTEIGNNIIDNKTDGNLSKQRPMQVRIKKIHNKSQQEKHRGYEQ